MTGLKADLVERLQIALAAEVRVPSSLADTQQVSSTCRTLMYTFYCNAASLKSDSSHSSCKVCRLLHRAGSRRG